MRRISESLKETAWTDAEALVEDVLQQAGDPGPMLGIDGGLTTVATVFDGLAGFSGPAARRHYQDRFEVIASPGTAVPGQAQPGDLLLGRAYGEGGIAWADTVHWEDVNEPEPEEPEPRRRRRRSRFRIDGPLPHNVMLVRPRRRGSEPADIEPVSQSEWASEFAAPVLETVDDTEAVTAADVRSVQSALNQLYRLNLATDGRIGRQTREAVQRFQRDHGLTPDGIPGPRTIAALREALAGADAGGQPSPQPAAPGPATGAACASLNSPVVFDRFEFGKDQVLPRHRALLRKLAECIVESLDTPTPVNNMDAVGHTDPVGSEGDNLALGRRRAINLKKALLDEIEAVRSGASGGIIINASSAGETQPLPGAHELSRRVEVSFTPPGTRAAPGGTSESAEDTGADEVRSVQQALNFLYGMHLPLDGDLDKETRAAVRRFQREHGLPATGEPGPATITALRKALASASTRRGEAAAKCMDLKSVVFDKFGFKEDRVRSIHQPLLHRLAECIVSSNPPLRKISVVGHTDPIGSDEYNMKLGIRRAQNLIQALKRELEAVRPGASKTISIEFSSQGDKQPRPGPPELSRRVEVVLTRPARVWFTSPLPVSENDRFEVALTKLEAKVNASADPRKWRYDCWLAKLKTGSVDDRLIRWWAICPSITGALGAAWAVGGCDLTMGSSVGQAEIEKRIRSIDDVPKVGNALGFITYLKSAIVVNEEFGGDPLESLRMLHDNVQAAITKLDLWSGTGAPLGGASAMPTAYVSIKDWIVDRRSDSNSLYSCL